MPQKKCALKRKAQSKKTRLTSAVLAAGLRANGSGVRKANGEARIASLTDEGISTRTVDREKELTPYRLAFQRHINSILDELGTLSLLESIQI